MTKKKIKYCLGELELGNSVYVSDPCYTPGIWCQAVVDGLKSGKWIGYMNKKTIKGWGIRVTDLWIVHQDYPNIFPNTLLDPNIGVDSGGAGIFDYDYYLKYHDDEKLDEEWYDRQFDLRYNYDKNGNRISETSSIERRDGIMLDGKCVVSFSGYGDGGYNLYAEKIQEEIVGLRIKFI